MPSRIRLLWGKGGYNGGDLLIRGSETATVKHADTYIIQGNEAVVISRMVNGGNGTYEGNQERIKAHFF